MTIDTLKTGLKAVGVKQASKAVERNQACVVFLALDAEGRINLPLRELCLKKNVPIEEVSTMAELGKACGIAVGAAAVAVLK